MSIVSTTRRLGLIGGALLLPGLALAQDFPERPVTMVVPFTPGAGGINDLIGRFVADGLDELWGETVIVENRPGAGTALGTSQVVRSRPDGHTLLFVSSTLASNTATAENLPYDTLEDLVPVAMAARGDSALVATPGGPIDSIQGLREEAAEGKVFYATSGIGSAMHVGAAHLGDALGIDMEAAHYSGGTEGLVDVAAGRVDIAFGAVGGLITNIRNDMTQPIVIMSEERSQSLPDVPTIVEAGYPDAVSYWWWGVFAPAGTPAELVERLNSDISTVLNSEEGSEFLANLYAEPSSMSAEEFAQLVRDEIGRVEDLASRIAFEAN